MRTRVKRVEDPNVQDRGHGHGRYDVTRFQKEVGSGSFNSGRPASTHAAVHAEAMRWEARQKRGHVVWEVRLSHS